MQGDSSPRWYPLTIQTRVARKLLVAQGTIVAYKETPDSLTILLNQEQAKEIQVALCPPTLCNLEAVEDGARVAVFIPIHPYSSLD